VDSSSQEKETKKEKEEMINDNHDWKRMYPDPEPSAGSSDALFWFFAGALSMLGLIFLIGYFV